jgi:hypothetical protein
MSTNLYWSRVSPRPRKALSTGFKWIIEEKFGPRTVLGESHVAWLEGVMDGTSNPETRESCDTLIKVIREDGAVEVWVE